MRADIAHCPLHTDSHFSLFMVCYQGQLMCGLDCDCNWTKCLASPTAANLSHGEAIQNTQRNILPQTNMLISEYK